MIEDRPLQERVGSANKEDKKGSKKKKDGWKQTKLAFPKNKSPDQKGNT